MYLRREGKFKSLPIGNPIVVVMDLKMPKVDGFDVLKWLKTQPALDGLNVIVFSALNGDSDIARAKELGAKDYIVKPSSTLDLIHAMREVTFKWLNLGECTQVAPL